MKRSKFWSASNTMIAIIVFVSAFSMFGLALGQETGSSDGVGEHRSESSEGGREGGGEHGDISVSSEGIGRGATVIARLPLSSET